MLREGWVIVHGSWIIADRQSESSEFVIQMQLARLCCVLRIAKTPTNGMLDTGYLCLVLDTRYYLPTAGASDL